MGELNIFFLFIFSPFLRVQRKRGVPPVNASSVRRKMRNRLIIRSALNLVPRFHLPTPQSEGRIQREYEEEEKNKNKISQRIGEVYIDFVMFGFAKL